MTCEEARWLRGPLFGGAERHRGAATRRENRISLKDIEGPKISFWH